MGTWEKLKEIFSGKQQPEHLRRGALGENAAKRHLKKQGLKFLTANFADKHGEIDLIFRETETLIFVEVKTRTHETFSRPADAVDRPKPEHETARNRVHGRAVAARVSVVAERDVTVRQTDYVVLVAERGARAHLEVVGPGLDSVTPQPPLDPGRLPVDPVKGALGAGIDEDRIPVR